MANLKSCSIFEHLYEVKGFNPSDFTKEKLDYEGNKSEYLPLSYKKAWARTVFPTHRCEACLSQITDTYVSAQAKFFADNDKNKAHIGEGFAFIYFDTYSDPTKAKTDACLLALGSAKSKAYSDAGFGLQFFFDNEVDEYEFDSIIREEIENLPSPSELMSISEAPKDEDTNILPTNSTSASPKDNQSDKTSIVSEESTNILFDSFSAAIESKSDTPEGDSSILMPTDVSEQIDMFSMDINDAKSITCSVEPYNGKSLGEIYLDNELKFRFIQIYELCKDDTEKEAIKVLIKSDSALTHYAARHNLMV